MSETLPNNKKQVPRQLRERKQRKLYSDEWALGDDEAEGGRGFSLADKLESPRFEHSGTVLEMHGSDLTVSYLQKNGFTTPLLFKEKLGLGLRAMEDSGCISRFFNEEESFTAVSPRLLQHSKSPNKSLDSSQDLSQVSMESEELSLSQLTIEEQEPIHIQPFYNITPRCMPVSPHYVVEEEFSSNPWAMLIATIFLTKTSGKTARPYMKNFFDEYPTPYHVLSDTPLSLERFFDNLGLRKRGHMIWKLTYQFVSSKWRRASDLCGIGKYGEDAYRIFCLGHTDIDPNDRYLKLYLDWLRGSTGFLEDNGAVDCEHVIEDPILNYYRITLRDGD